MVARAARGRNLYPMPRENDVAHLHPAFRSRSLKLERLTASAGLPIRRYEGWRDPNRQADLWAFGRVSGVGTPGRHKTFERAWESSHQWGLAEDWVWWSPEAGWSWAAPAGHSWDKFHELAQAADLEYLKFEEPHVQLPEVHGRLILAGARAGLENGDASWEKNLEDAIHAWGPLPRKDRYGQLHPGVPDVFDDRPAAPVPPGMVYDEERGLCLPDDATS